MEQLQVCSPGWYDSLPLNSIYLESIFHLMILTGHCDRCWGRLAARVDENHVIRGSRMMTCTIMHDATFFWLPPRIYNALFISYDMCCDGLKKLKGINNKQGM